VTRRPSIEPEDHLQLWQRSTFGLAALALCSGLLTACGSSASGVGSNGTFQSVCQDVTAVLSDGPDPDSDPVGYALAQVKPLRQIQTSERALKTAIDNLAAAYESVVETNNSNPAKQAVSVASGRVDTICPGATS
jgi:hypothetical protein